MRIVKVEPHYLGYLDGLFSPEGGPAAGADPG
jgi:hypothetical protein